MTSWKTSKRHPLTAIGQLRAALESRVEHAEAETGNAIELTLRRLRLDLIRVESDTLTSLYDGGAIGARTRRALQRRLDLEQASLDD